MNLDQLEKERQKYIEVAKKRVLTDQEIARRNAIEWALRNRNKSLEQLRKETNRLYAAMKRLQQGRERDTDFDLLVTALHAANAQEAKIALSERYNLLKQLAE